MTTTSPVPSRPSEPRPPAGAPFPAGSWDPYRPETWDADPAAGGWWSLRDPRDVRVVTCHRHRQDAEDHAAVLYRATGRRPAVIHVDDLP